MKKKATDSSKKKGKKKKVDNTSETPVWGDPDCKSFVYHPTTGKPINPFPNLRDQESIIPFFSDRVEQKRKEIELQKKKEEEEKNGGSLYRPIKISPFGEAKEEDKKEDIPKPIIDLHRFEWINKESWIRCRLRQRNWSYNDMLLNVQCSWTLLRLKIEIVKHLFQGSLITNDILIYKEDLSIKKENKNESEEEEEDINNATNDTTTTNNDTKANQTTSLEKSKSSLFSVSTDESKEDENDLDYFSKNQECNEPLYKLFPRIFNLRFIGKMIPFEESFVKCEDNDYPILVVGQRPIHIYEPPAPPPPPPAKKVKKKGSKKKKSDKKKKTVKKKDKEEEESPPPPSPEVEDPNTPKEPNDSELLNKEDEDDQLCRDPNQILKNPDQYLYVFFDIQPIYDSI